MLICGQLPFSASSASIRPIRVIRVLVKRLLRRMNALKECRFRYKVISWYPGVFILQGCTASDITETRLYKEGKVYIQSLSSLIPPLLLGPRPGEMICDLCAAPGSKTTQVACTMKNQGTIIAVDNNKKRFYKLRANLSNQGATMVRAYLMDGEAVGRKYPEKFDRILLDAPCSAEGRFRLSDPKTFCYWSPRKIKEIVRKQRRLLIAAFRALKPGGVLVYSTCTFAPEENEGALNWFVEKVEETILPEPIKLPISNITQALSEWKGKSLHASLQHAVRITPSELMEGFFVCRLRKGLNV